MAIGLEDLLRRFDGEQPVMALMVAKAPLGSVVSGLADTYGTAPLIEGAPVRVASHQEKAGEVAGWLAAVEQRDEPWVCVYVALGEVVELECDLVRQVAADLSDTLSTQAIAFSISAAESGDGDDALVAEFKAFDEGETSEWVRFRVGGQVETFESDSREAPEEDEVDLDFAHRLFADRGIFVPACSPKSRGQQAWLALWDLEPSRIRRADLFRLRGSSFFEDETLTMDVPGLEAAAAEAGGRLSDDPDLEPPGDENAPSEQAAGGWRRWIQRLFAGNG